MTVQVLSDLLQMRGSINRFSPKDRETAEKYAEAKKALNVEAQENWGDESWHREQAAILQSDLDYGFTFDNLFNSWFVVRQVPEFEKLYLRERRGMKVFFTHRGGYIEESQITTDDWEVPRDTIGFHVSEFGDKLRANFADAIETIAGLGQQRLEAEINRRAFTILQQAVPTTSPYYVDASTTGLTQAILDSTINDVADSIQPNGLGPVPVTILGRARAMTQINNFNLGFDPEATAEIRARGRLGVYRGATIQRITNYTDENGLPYINDNEVWVFGGTAGVFAYYGGPQTKTWDENTTDYRHYRHRRDIGGLINHPEQVRRIRIA